MTANTHTFLADEVGAIRFEDRFCASKESVGQGEVGGSTALADNAWWLLQLAIERVW